MTNLRQEFLKHTKEQSAAVTCVLIQEEHWSIYDPKSILLKQSYTVDGYVKFLESIDIEYDSGYGTQYFSGTIWYEDGTWSERREYDGSEWWEHCSCPSIPEELQ